MAMNQEMERLYNATDNLIEQQFYLNGSDTIIGRTPDIRLHIRNSGRIIKKLKNLFNENMDLFLEGNYFKFLLLFTKIKGVTEELVREIHENLKKKIKELGKTLDDLTIVIKYTIVLSSLISTIRDIHFNDAIEELIKRIKRKSKGLNDDFIQDYINELFMRNNENISIVYNLSYLDALAESFNFKKVSHTCKIQKGKYINRIVTSALVKYSLTGKGQKRLDH